MIDAYMAAALFVSGIAALLLYTRDGGLPPPRGGDIAVDIAIIAALGLAWPFTVAVAILVVIEARR
uniref:Uncharacterized protein n=1 Tax=Mycobacterium phage JustASigh TaxID=3158894 RepID=A0AAU8GMC9_9CAUD